MQYRILPMESNSTDSVKTPVRVERFAELEFKPHFEYGQMAELAETCGSSVGSQLIYEAKYALLSYAIHPSL